ncbi:hypothetical protein NC653_019121 [Populus alba x Populus x berolinensis]|uniref:Uncharacterized protein n=1 Tax=Populus alba x Populus x berolinensis TaxID=444605 RepID=A0AAD6QI18_9ROSI|nr:hypothetical protein NC653_019121 [Populus alba x Populus x berolinensis]
MEFFKAVQGHLVTMGLDLKRVDFQAKIYWTTCRLRLFLLSDIPHLWIVIVQQGGAQVKILGVEEIGDRRGSSRQRRKATAGNGEKQAFCRRGKCRFFPIIKRGMMDLVIKFC